MEILRCATKREMLFFGPSLKLTSDPVCECLKRINISFQMKKSAIIGSHRLNFIGTLNKNNRTTNLKLLGELLKQIITKWPEVEFMNSDRLSLEMYFSDNEYTNAFS